MNSIIQATSLRINKPAIPAVEENKLRTEIRNYILFFIFALVISGVTAFPIETELAFIYNHISFFPLFLQEWISKVYFAVETTNEHYPFLSYGTDWLAFAHLVIATAFLGPLLNPVKKHLGHSMGYDSLHWDLSTGIYSRAYQRHSIFPSVDRLHLRCIWFYFAFHLL